MRTLGAEAHLYFCPLLAMEATRLQVSVDEPEGTRSVGGPANTWVHLREYPAADIRSVVRPNHDTLGSTAFLDLSGGLVLVTVPEASDR